MVCACQVSVSARLRRRSDRRGKTEHGTPLPSCAVFVLLASAARRLLGVAIAPPRGSALSRESLTQDSRSTVKARLIDPLRESFGKGRCAPSRYKTWRPLRGRHVGSEPSSCEGTPLTAPPTVVCARTSLAVAPLMTTRAGSTVHARYGRTPCHWRARGSLQTSGARVVRGMHRTLAASSGWGSDEGRRCLRSSAGAGRLGAALDRDWERGDHRHEQNDDAP